MPKGLRLPKVVRVTTAIDPEVLKVFEKMSAVSGVSLARTLGTWCEQTADGARVAIDMMTQAKNAPRFVMSEFHNRALHEQQQLEEFAHNQQQPGRTTAVPAAQPPAGQVSRLRTRTPPPPPPRPVIRGETLSHGGLRKGSRG